MLSNDKTMYHLTYLTRKDGVSTSYFLSDALGLVRQLVDGAWSVTLAKW